MADDNESPETRDPLRRIAKLCVILGIVSLVRFGPEILLILGAHPNRAYFAVLSLDILVALLWLKCGTALRKRAFQAIGFVALGGAIIFAHGAVWGYFFGKELVRSRGSMGNDLSALAFMGSRMLIYASEFAFWPFAFVRFQKLTEELNPTLKWSVLRGIVAAFLIGAVLQVVLFLTVVDR